MVMAFVHLGYLTQIRSGHTVKRSNAIAMSARRAELRTDQLLIGHRNRPGDPEPPCSEASPVDRLFSRLNAGRSYAAVLRTKYSTSAGRIGARELSAS